MSIKLPIEMNTHQSSINCTNSVQASYTVTLYNHCKEIIHNLYSPYSTSRLVVLTMTMSCPVPSSVGFPEGSETVKYPQPFLQYSLNKKIRRISSQILKITQNHNGAKR